MALEVWEKAESLKAWKDNPQFQQAVSQELLALLERCHEQLEKEYDVAKAADLRGLARAVRFILGLPNTWEAALDENQRAEQAAAKAQATAGFRRSQR